MVKKTTTSSKSSRFRWTMGSKFVDNIDRGKSFLIILNDLALQFYSISHRNLNSIDYLCHGMQKRFLTESHVHARLLEREPIALISVLWNRKDKQSVESHKLLVSGLQDIQSELSKKQRNNVLFQNKLLSAVKGVDACRLLYFNPAKSMPAIRKKSCTRR